MIWRDFYNFYFQLFALILLLTFYNSTLAQDGLQVVSNNCKEPIKLNLNKQLIYGPTDAPEYLNAKSYIPINEDKLWFKREHYCFWYEFVAPKNCLLEFDIISANQSQDNDFELFKVDSFNVCELIKNKQIVPVRSNLSADNKYYNGKTGLLNSSTIDFAGSGKNLPYSKSLLIRKNEKFILIIDNVSSKVLGHTIKFKLNDLVRLKCKTRINSKGVSIPCTLTDTLGNELMKFISNKNGIVDTLLAIDKSKNYYIGCISDSAGFLTKKINFFKISDEILLDLNTIKKGHKITCNNILFETESSKLIQESLTELKMLLLFLNEDKSSKILIEGHCNGYTGGEKKASELSTQRALVVYNFLIENGINKERLTYVGKGFSEMIYKNTTDEKLVKFNRRIEIKILEK